MSSNEMSADEDIKALRHSLACEVPSTESESVYHYYRIAFAHSCLPFLCVRVGIAIGTVEV